MTEQLTAWEYARNEGCFTDHRGPSFHPDSRLKSLKATAFSLQTDLLADERDRDCDLLASSDSGLEGDEDRSGSTLLLKRLEQQCKTVDEFSRLLPRWNDVYNNLALSTDLMEGFDIDLDLAEYQEQLENEKAFRSRSPADAELAQMVSEMDMVNERLRNLLTEPLKCLHEDLFLLPIHDTPQNVDHDERSPEPEPVKSAMDLPCKPNSSANFQHIESSTSEDYRHENGNGMTTEFKQPCRGRDSASCSPKLAQFMTLPLPSSDSYGEMHMMCDTPKSCEQSLSDNWTVVECVSPTNDSLDKRLLPPNTAEGETTARDAVQLCKTLAPNPAHFTAGEDGDAESAKETKSISAPSQDRQSDYVKENRDNEPPRLGLEREHFGSSHLLFQFMAMIGATERVGNERFHDGSLAMQSTTFQASEVDVSLTVEDGIIVTTLLQIRQKPLPSSKTLTAIRQRVSNLSQKYPRLTIFVLESPGSRDDMSELSPKDLGIYNEFVCFASSLKADVSVHLVPGGDKTLSRWILSLMIRFAPQLMELDKTTTIGNSTWELFFRQTGMNLMKYWSTEGNLESKGKLRRALWC
ncbi:hypothetical protein E4U43_008433 [Claviceps pusilla]|uniref:DUF7102 domain-containing protein n=1 Tax=Claviceps pusilla TaxID=123648 RepID=A0A9P7SZW3_9HYPO|nr:hypothetical protein E4U43_008433 [Claviceps pusilla]